MITINYNYDAKEANLFCSTNIVKGIASIEQAFRNFNIPMGDESTRIKYYYAGYVFTYDPHLEYHEISKYDFVNGNIVEVSVIDEDEIEDICLLTMECDDRFCFEFVKEMLSNIEKLVGENNE